MTTVTGSVSFNNKVDIKAKTDFCKCLVWSDVWSISVFWLLLFELDLVNLYCDKNRNLGRESSQRNNPSLVLSFSFRVLSFGRPRPTTVKLLENPLKQIWSKYCGEIFLLWRGKYQNICYWKIIIKQFYLYFLDNLCTVSYLDLLSIPTWMLIRIYWRDCRKWIYFSSLESNCEK